jgi:cell division transport system permease protein
MFKHAIFEGIKNLIRSFWLSITAIFIITVSLTSVAIVASLWVGVGYLLQQFDQQGVIYVDIKEGVTQQDREIMFKDIRSLSEVKEVTFIDKARAAEDLKENPTLSNTVDNLQKSGEKTQTSINFLKESFKIIPINVNQYDKVKTFVSQDKYTTIVDNVQGTQQYIETVQRIYYWTAIIGAVLVVTFAIISILVMINILRIAIYSRRDEIEIMRLVGATNAYIRGPFIAEGILYNFFAAIIVFIIFTPLIVYLGPSIQGFVGLSTDSNVASAGLMNNLYISLTLTNIGGLVIGGLAATLATQRYLRL